MRRPYSNNARCAGLSRETFARGEAVGLNPMGYKIGLELMVRSRCLRVKDVPITFRERVAGKCTPINCLTLQHEPAERAPRAHIAVEPNARSRPPFTHAIKHTEGES